MFKIFIITIIFTNMICLLILSSPNTEKVLLIHYLNFNHCENYT